MSRYVLLGWALIGFAQSVSAGWWCEMECNTNAYYELDRMLKHSSGPDHEDFQSNCKQALQGSVTGIQQGCDYIYCRRYLELVEIRKGFGETLAEARKDARRSCVTDYACGVGAFRSVGEFWCEQYFFD